MTFETSSRLSIALVSLVIGLISGITLTLFYNSTYNTPDIVNKFHKLYYNSDKTWIKNHWLGIQAYQNPNDAWIVQEIITDVQPDVIVETGTAFGGSAALWSMILGQIKPDGEVISIDVKDRVNIDNAPPIIENNVEFMIGSSTDSLIVNQVKEKVRNKRTLVILDSKHEMSHVLKELKLYAPLVSRGSYIIIQDTNLNGHPVRQEFGPGPMEAVHTFLSTNDRFRIDRDRERLLFTMHPNGYLRRVR